MFEKVRAIAAVQEPPARLSPDTFTWLAFVWPAAFDLKGKRKHRAVMNRYVEAIALMIAGTAGVRAEEHATLAVFDEDAPCMVFNGGLLRGFRLYAPAWQPSGALEATWVRMREHGKHLRTEGTPLRLLWWRDWLEWRRTLVILFLTQPLF